MIYLACGREVNDVIASMMNLYHKELVAMNVTVSASYVFAERHEETGDPQGRGLEWHGVAADAVVRGTRLKERVQGRADVEILVCGVAWTEMTRKERDALIDHELYHVELIIDRETGEPKLDDSGRPLLNMREHDVDMGWFLEVAERHGEHSGEVRQARGIVASYGEILMINQNQSTDLSSFSKLEKTVKSLRKRNENLTMENAILNTQIKKLEASIKRKSKAKK